jgi:hypothetical protein
VYLTVYFKVLCDFVFECSCVLIQVLTIYCNEKGDELGVTKKNSDSDNMELRLSVHYSTLYHSVQCTLRFSS